MALARTDGCAIIAIGTGAFGLGPPTATHTSLPTRRNARWLRPIAPGSTQNTLRSTGSLSAGTMRLCRYAILLASGNDLTRQQQQRPFGIVDQHQPVHLRSVVS